jgi:hypothetical protein
MPRIHAVTQSPFTGLACASVLAVFHIAYAPSADADETESDGQETIEEIIVYGEKSLSQLRRDLHLASEAFFDVYNALNSDDDFDILCDYETKLGERRRNHVCRPRFALKAEARETSAYLLSGAGVQRSTGPAAGFNAGNGFVSPTAKRVLEKEALMWEEVSELLAQHPELREAMAELVRAKNGYESERQRRKND